jgi:hypothetical protein
MGAIGYTVDEAVEQFYTTSLGLTFMQADQFATLAVNVYCPS